MQGKVSNIPLNSEPYIIVTNNQQQQQMKKSRKLEQVTTENDHINKMISKKAIDVKRRDKQLSEIKNKQSINQKRL